MKICIYISTYTVSTSKYWNIWSTGLSFKRCFLNLIYLSISFNNPLEPTKLIVNWSFKVFYKPSMHYVRILYSL